MKSTPFMAAKSLLISFSQILASKMFPLFVPTSANSFSICERLEWKKNQIKRKKNIRFSNLGKGFLSLLDYIACSDVLNDSNLK